MAYSRNTLQNPLLFSSFVKKARKADPEFDIELVDRSLEPSEAENDLRRRGHLRGGRPSFDPMKEYRGSLFDMGIKHPRMQNFVMRQDNVKQEDLDILSYIFNQRPHSNWKRDIARKAKPAKSVRQYAKNPNRYDIPGVDTPGSIFDPDWF